MHIYYRLPDCDDDETTGFELPGAWNIYRPIEQRQIAEEAAKDCFHNHDGWEISWPQVVALHDGENGPEIARFTVEMEAEPVFYAAPVSDT